MIDRTIAHYRILEKWGSGGMGVVCKAEDTRLHRYVALKFPPQEFAKTPQAVARFQREAQAASALNHPNICTIYDIGEHKGHAFIVMEYLDGLTLRYKIGGRPLDLEETPRYAIEIVDALDVAHAAGIIHRDIKAANVLITRRGQAKVLDFGLAKLMADVQSGGPNDPTMAVNELTTAGGTLGTVAYMSPEQIEGKVLDGRTDVFSFGIVLYEMMTGRSPFEKARNGATFGAILHEQPILPRTLNAGIPPRLEEVIEKTLEKNRDLRYQHASEIRADLQRLKRDMESGRVSSQSHISKREGSGTAAIRTLYDAGSRRRSAASVRRISETDKSSWRGAEQSNRGAGASRPGSLQSCSWRLGRSSRGLPGFYCPLEECRCKHSSCETGPVRVRPAAVSRNNSVTTSPTCALTIQ